jgi:hypothetical protein
MEPLSAIGICTLTLGTLAAALYVARREACHQRALLADHVRSATCSSDGVGIPVNLDLLPLLWLSAQTMSNCLRTPGDSSSY